MSNRLAFEFAVKVRKSTIRELQASRREQLAALASTATRIIERPARRDGERLRGKIAFPELPNGIADGCRISRLAEFVRIKTNSSGLITPKAGWSTRVSRGTYKDWLRGQI